VSGEVWFDRNQDGVRGAHEWPLPGVSVTLTSPGGAASRTSHQVSWPSTTTTDAIGHYSFSSVPAGRWTVHATLDAAGLERTSDTDGLKDWSVAVSVVPGQTASASFAGLGKGTLGGTVFTSTTGSPVADAQVVCRWAGFDDQLGTSDDVEMTVTAASDGTFSLLQVPYGTYSCGGTDPATGARSVIARALVRSPAAVVASLPITPEAAPPAVSPAEVPGTPAPRTPATQLPFTGADTRGLLAWGLGLLVAGLLTLVGGRRRRAGSEG
jgi:hypothetical protein